MISQRDVIFCDVTSKQVMVDVAFTLQREEILAYIKIESFAWKEPVRNFDFFDVDPNYSFGFSTICRWMQKFNSGGSELLLKHNSGRPRSATDGINTEKVAQILNTDRSLNSDKIAYEAGLKGASVYRILTENEKQRWVIINKQLPASHMDEGEIMLNRVVPIDETWIRSFEPELKCQSSEWNTPNSPCL